MSEPTDTPAAGGLEEAPDGRQSGGDDHARLEHADRPRGRATPRSPVLRAADALTLVFNPYEIAALFAAILIAAYATVEESTWSKGVQLLGLYVAFVVLFLLA